MFPEMQPVVSTNVAAIGYDAEAEEVYVEFLQGRTYAYARVSLSVWQDFETTDSKGTFVNKVLKPGYLAREI